MQENSLYKAIYNLGSVKELAKKLGIQREHIYAWIKGVSKIPLEYALQIDYLTGGEIDWKELVPFHVVQRLKHLTLLLPKFEMPPCELVYVSIERIQSSNACNCFIGSKQDPLSLNKERPICIDTNNVLIFGEKTLELYKEHQKRTIPAWRISLLDLAQGHYDQELLLKNFLISERVAMGLALEKFLGKRQGQRNDLKLAEPSSSEFLKKEITSNKLMQPAAQVVVKRNGRLRQFIARRLGFGSHFTYLSAKKIKLQGIPALIDSVDQKELAISSAVQFIKFSTAEQEKLLNRTKKNPLKNKMSLNKVFHTNRVAVNANFNPSEENYALSNVRCQNLV
jgi:DNA-binding transcriptional regulator YdaS (Cro superfamily)